jgi:hypothetical protein
MLSFSSLAQRQATIAEKSRVPDSLVYEYPQIVPRFQPRPSKGRLMESAMIPLWICIVRQLIETKFINGLDRRGLVVNDSQRAK